MKKSAKGEVVLSACQIQATRLNRLEYHRLQRNIDLLREDLQEHMARIQRQKEGLKLHFTNVVRVIKPNPAFQLWKQAHAQEIAQDEAEVLIESFKLKQKLQSKTPKKTTTTSNETPSEPFRPLLLLLDHNSKKSVDPIFGITDNFLRPKTVPIVQQVPSQHRVNPFLSMLDGRPASSNNIFQQPPQHRINPLLTMLDNRPASSNNVFRHQQQYDSPSSHSLHSTGTTGARKLFRGKFASLHKKADLDALYRMALQNQTAYKSVAQTRIADRKLHDKEFASRHRALKGSMRSAGFVN